MFLRREVTNSMKANKIIVSLSAFFLLSMALLASNSLAYKGDPSQQGPDCTPEKHELMEKAFEENDYNAWSQLMQGKGKVVQVITENNFSRFAQAHQLAEEGKIDEANAIRQELGLGQQNGQGQGQGLGQGQQKGYGRKNK
jgi:hypothetical protein